MSTAPPGSDGTDTSKKRPIEEVVANATSQIQESVNKRAHLGGIEFGKEYAIKLLVANKDAGTVIGRSGATIQTIQAKTGCRVRVSNNNDFFPGTDQRVVLVTGPSDSVSAGVLMIMSELFENAEEIHKNGGLVAESVAVTMSILVPEKASGLIIGHGGENIRSMVEQSGSKIQLTSKDKQPPGLDERILVCTGTLPQVKVGCALIVMKICEDPNATYTNMTTLYSRYNGGAAAQAAMGGMGMAGMGAYSGMTGMAGLIGMPGMDAYSAQMGQLGQMDPYAGYGALIPGADPYGQYGAASAAYSATPVVNAQGGMTYTLYVPDSAIPSMVGRGGVIIKEMQQQTGATIKISQKGEYAPGTMNRIVTITGTPQASSWAYSLVQAKLPPMY